MKRKYAYIIGLSTLVMSLSSCHFNVIFKDKVESVSLSGSKQYFVVGQSYFDYSSVSLTVTYKDKTTSELSKDDVKFTLTHLENKFDIYSPLTEAGEYSLIATYKETKSKPIKFTVFEEEQYISSITAEGKSELGTGGVALISLTLNPEVFTVEVSASSGDENIATVNKVDNYKFRVKAVASGEVNITFSAPSGVSTFATAVHHMTINAYDKVEIKQTYKDYVENNYYTLSSCPVNGEPKLLVIPVWFTDSKSYILESKKETVKADIQKAYFGDSSDTGWHSVSSYYEEESRGALKINGTVSDWYSSGLSASEVGAYNSKQTSGLVKDTVDWYFTNHKKESRLDYDYDGDGYLDGVMLIYAAPDSQVLSSIGENMWAYCYWCQESTEKDPSNPGVNAFFWASYDFMYGSNRVNKQTGKNYHNGDTTHALIDTHTYVHEMGHVLGLEDYYDYHRKEDRSPATIPCGAFSMQDYNVGGHEAFSILSFGWSEPYIPSDSCTITIEEFQSSHELILLTPSWNEYDSPFDEYLLLELYSPNGLNEFDCTYQYGGNYPQGPKSVGIRLWHVDARLFSSYTWTTNAKSSRVLTGLNNTSNYSTRPCNAGPKYQSYNLLQLIRNSTSETYKSTSFLSSSDLFKAGSSFSISKYAKQFVNGETLDSGLSLGWSFSVDSIQDVGGTYAATISLVKE